MAQAAAGRDAHDRLERLGTLSRRRVARVGVRRRVRRADVGRIAAQPADEVAALRLQHFEDLSLGHKQIPHVPAVARLQVDDAARKRLRAIEVDL